MSTWLCTPSKSISPSKVSRSRRRARMRTPTSASEIASDEFGCLEVNAGACPRWGADVEPVLVFHRRGECWAVQESCPHASISLCGADIEDLRAEYPATAGPCLVCPAHMYVFDAGSGACLTNRTPPARTYRVGTTTAAQRPTHDEQGEGAAAAEAPARHVWVCRHPQSRPPPPPSGGSGDGASAAAPSIGREDANAIQLRLVERGLRRKFGSGSS